MVLRPLLVSIADSLSDSDSEDCEPSSGSMQPSKATLDVRVT
jgi:hypothetical protein